ncbi:hypothetical protein OLD34_08280 [Streptococcus pneumoniae]|nr:hypothetical protein [Streptococcus pneumoniae]
MKIKEQTRKLTLGCSKHSSLKLEQYTSTSKTLLEIDLTVLIDLSYFCFILLYSFEMADRTDEVSSKQGFEVVDKAKLMWFEEVFEECKKILVS